VTESLEWSVADEDLEFDDDEPGIPRRRHWVNAVIVTHDGATWLRAVLTTIAGQTRPPDAIVGVDNASTDDSARLLRESLSAARVVETGINAGFGGAVDEGLRLIGDWDLPDDAVEWIWLLHDDSAPDPDCLDHLLLTADKFPAATILGPKILGWHDRRLLLEVGVSVDSDGRRVTGLERREHDQGQHDGPREVLAVSSAGMLIRRDVFEALQGFDPYLPLYRDDVDLCWRAWRRGERVMVATEAVVHHREASAHARRRGDDRPHRDDREAAAHLLLAHANPFLAPIVALRLLVGSAIRSAVYLLGKDFRSARDEVAAVARVAFHPRRLRASRTLASQGVREPASVVRQLRPTTVDQLRDVTEAIGGYLTTSSSALSPSVSALDSIDESVAYLPDESYGRVRRILTKPSVLLTVILLCIAVAATRSLWWGEGVVQGGALLPAPVGASDIWQSYTEAWHDVGPGSTAPSAPYLIVVAVLATVLLGKSAWAIAVVLMLVIPIAGWSAYIASRDMVPSKITRAWMAGAYALLPAMTGAIASGRIGTTIASIALPFAIRSLWRLTTARGSLRRAAGTALLISIVLATVPAMWLVLVFATIVLTLRRVTRQVALRLALALAVPLAVLMPWTWYLITHPVLFLLEPGLHRASLIDPDLAPFDVLALHPGGPGMTPLWVTGGILLGGVLALLWRDTLPLVGAWWVIGALAALVGVVQSLIRVTPPGYAEAFSPWPGSATLVWGLSLICASGVAVRGLRERFVRSNFTVWQPIAVVAVIGAVAAPIISAIWWIPARDLAVSRAPVSPLPAFVVAEAASPQAPRSLVVASSRAGAVTYSLVNGGGQTLGDAETLPPAEVWTGLDDYVAWIVSGRGGPEVPAIAGYGVRYVVLDRGTTPDLIQTLDSEPGLRRLASADGAVLWRVAGVTSRARVVADADQAPLGLMSPEIVGFDPYIDQSLPEGSGQRVVVVGASQDAGWRASSGGAGLTPVIPPEPLTWSSAFLAPDGPEPIRVWFDSGARPLWLWVQVVIIAGLVVLSLPSRRTFDPDPDAEVTS
jgi:GT2 family glycosyltransferase